VNIARRRINFKEKTSAMNRWAGILATLALLGGGYYFWGQWKSKSRDTSGLRLPPTAVVEYKDILFSVNGAGDIGPADQVSVRPEVDGKIATLLVDIGDKVKKGDVLFTLDDRVLQTQRSSQVTVIEGAKLQLDKAKRNYDRDVTLFQEKLVSNQVFDDARTDFDLAKNVLEKEDKTLGTLDEQLSLTKIRAPFDCTILTRPVSVGQEVSGSSGYNSGTEVLTIANLSDMVVSAHINQADVTRVRQGQEVDIHVESVPGLHIPGKVQLIAPQATIKNNIKGFDARIVITELDPRVRPGMTANLKIPVSSASNILAVPLAAVFTDPMTEDRYVYVKTDDSYERRDVHIGVSDYSLAEITRGLVSNELVCLEMPAEALINKPEPKPGDADAAHSRALASVARMSTNLLAQAGTNKTRLKTALP
jgi:RND family efflux transporter MFP subunit